MTPLNESIPYGFCHCGCGRQTLLTNGVPRKFIVGHWNRIRPVPEKAIAFKIEGVYCRLIPLTRGQWTIVWEEDYLKALDFCWYAWWCDNTHSFYARCNLPTVDGKRSGHLLHRHLLGLFPQDVEEVDHKNCVTLDNRRSNLRIATYEQNARNRKTHKNNSTGCRGVTFRERDGSYEARIRIGGKSRFLGRFKTLQDGKNAYEVAAEKHFGEFYRKLN